MRAQPPAAVLLDLSQGATLGASGRLDVYAFGISVWEMWTARTPYADMPDLPLAQLLLCVAEGLRPDARMLPPLIRRIVEECWTRAEWRPEFGEVARQLAQLRDADIE